MNNIEIICANVRQQAEQLLAKRHIINGIRDQSGAKNNPHTFKLYMYKILKQCQVFNTNVSRARTMDIIRNFIYFFQQKDPYYWLKDIDCINEVYSVYCHLLYYMDVLQCPNTESSDTDLQIGCKCPPECPPEIKTNCLYTVLLRMYNRWIDHKLHSTVSENFYISLTDKTYNVDDINRTFYEIHYVLTHYTPKYNPDTYSCILWLDGQGCFHCCSEFYTEQSDDQRINKYPLEELLCIKCQSIYLEPNQEEIAIYVLYQFKYKLRISNNVLAYIEWSLFTFSEDGVLVIPYKNNKKILENTIKNSHVYNSESLKTCFLNKSPQIDPEFIMEYNTCTDRDRDLECRSQYVTQDRSHNFTIKISLNIKTFTFEYSITDNSQSISLDEFFNLAQTSDLAYVKFEEAENNYRYVHELNVYETVFAHVYKIIFEPFFKYKKFHLFKKLSQKTNWLSTDIVTYILPKYL